MLSASAFSAHEILDQVVAKGLTNAHSVQDLVATLDFDDVFTAMSTDEVLESLVRQRLTKDFDDVGALKAEIARRGIDLTGLRADGLLTLLAVAPEGTLLVDTPRNIRAQLKADFAQAPLPLLDALEPLNLLELFDHQFQTSATDARIELTALAWRDTQPGLSNVVNLANLAYYTVNGKLTLVSPQTIVNETNLQPPGEHAAIAFGIQQLPGYFEGYIDPVDAQGRAVPYPLPWMDQWADTVAQLMDSYIGEFKRLGGTLDVFLVDMESKAFSMHGLATADPVDPSASNPTIWEAIQADSRWPELRARLERAGLWDFTDLGNWNELDPRALIWDAVMSERRREYLERALYEPVRKHFPEIRFSNYDNAYRNQSIPGGSYTKFTETWATIGTIVGTHQSKPLYGAKNAVAIPGETIDATPNLESGIEWIEGVNGVVTVSVYGDLSGLRVGDDIRIFNQCQPYVEDYVGNFQVSRVVDDHTFQYLLPGTHERVELPPDVYCTGMVGTRSSYDGLVHDVKFLRTQLTTSDAPLLPWISSPGWVEFSEGIRYDHWTEGIFHAALSGATEFAFWNTKGMDPELQGNVQMDRALGELEPLVGFASRVPLSYSDVDWSDDFLLTGMDVGGRRIWRLTPNPDVSFRVVNAARGELEIDGRLWSLPNSSIQAGGASSLGVWIIQRYDDSPLRYSAATTWNRIWTQPAETRVEVVAPSAVAPGQPYYVSAQLVGQAAQQTALFAFDWQGDGHADAYAVGDGQVGLSLTAGVSRLDRVVVTAYDLQGRTLGLGSRLVDSRHIWIVSDGDQRNLVIGGTEAADVIVVTDGAMSGVVHASLTLGPGHVQRSYSFAGINGRILVFGIGGNDILAAGPATRRSVELYGGWGNDLLQGGAGDDVLSGGFGDDTLLAGAGRDLLYGGAGADILSGGDGGDELIGGDGRDVVIGGWGQDYLFGGDGDDLLVAGATLWDANLPALHAIRAEWNSQRTLAQRVANLSGQGTGRRANGDIFLLPGLTVVDDGLVDYLFGGEGRDWRIFRPGYDVLLDPFNDEPGLHIP